MHQVQVDIEQRGRAGALVDYMGIPEFFDDRSRHKNRPSAFSLQLLLIWGRLAACGRLVIGLPTRKLQAEFE
jgi:hypothetical protein